MGTALGKQQGAFTFPEDTPEGQGKHARAPTSSRSGRRLTQVIVDACRAVVVA